MNPRGAGWKDDLAKSLSETRISKENIEKLVSAGEQGHNLFLLGAPGVGKTMSARRYAEALGGPFRAPHYTISLNGMQGGKSGRQSLYLGEIGGAHGGTLFLDDAPEFSLQVLEEISRAYKEGFFTTYLGKEILDVHYPHGPKGFRLILSSNPCPCGYRETPQKKCACSDELISRYFERVGSLRELCETEVRLSLGTRGGT